jgi:hypothetical protein
MPKPSRISFPALTAALLVLGVVATAYANRVSISSTGIRIVWTQLEFSDPSSGIRIKCPAALEGSFHSRSIAKVSGALIALATSATITTASCTGGSVRLVAASLPWHIRYNFFTGTLPSIAEVHVQFVNVEFEAVIPLFEGLLCRYRSTAESPALMTLKREISTGHVLLVRAEGRIPSSTPICPTLSLEGFGTMTQPGVVTKITLTLVA